MSFVTTVAAGTPLPVDASCPAPLPQAGAEPEPVITNDGWFPDVDPAEIRRVARIRESVTPDRLRFALIGAIITVSKSLALWQAAHLIAGYATLATVPARAVDGHSQLVLLYQRAVAFYAKAEIVERYRDIDITGKGERNAEDLDPSVGELRRDAIHAIRDMLGRGRTDVELI